MKKYKKYTVGFLFDQKKENVVLIRKNRPEWQAGRLNGVGGKIEDGETSSEAMSREFWEETGANIKDWKYIASLFGEIWVVEVFTTTDQKAFEVASTTTDEEIVKLPVIELFLRNDAISNVYWLVQLCRNHKDIITPVSVGYIS